MSTLHTILLDQSAAWDASTTRLTPEEVQAAREWVKDCLGTFHDLENEGDVDQLSDGQIARGIARHYSGGIAAFKASVHS